MKRNILMAVYSHPEAYPPTLNAIEILSRKFNAITIVHRNVMKSDWDYPNNVNLIAAGAFTHYTEVGRKSILWKIRNFWSFITNLRTELKRSKPEWIILYEPIAVLAWYFVRLMVNSKAKVWYHNHDVIQGDESFFSKWSFKAQNKLFETFDIFSLPSDERKQYFPMSKFKGKYYFIPNFPGRYLYDRYYQRRTKSKKIKLLYQGHIGLGHGLEEIIHLIKMGVHPEHSFTLVLKGYRDEVFLTSLVALAKSLGIEDQLEIHGVTSYRQVPEVASTCHIGIGIHTRSDVMTSTLGTASNKIYEYAGVGLPVLLFDNVQFRQHLENFRWAFFTDVSIDDLRSKICAILADYELNSTEARKDFEEKLNFENYFNNAINGM